MHKKKVPIEEIAKDLGKRRLKVFGKARVSYKTIYSFILADKGGRGAGYTHQRHQASFARKRYGKNYLGQLTAQRPSGVLIALTELGQS